MAVRKLARCWALAYTLGKCERGGGSDDEEPGTAKSFVTSLVLSYVLSGAWNVNIVSERMKYAPVVVVKVNVTVLWTAFTAFLNAATVLVVLYIIIVYFVVIRTLLLLGIDVYVTMTSYWKCYNSLFYVLNPTFLLFLLFLF